MQTEQQCEIHNPRHTINKRAKTKNMTLQHPPMPKIETEVTQTTARTARERVDNHERQRGQSLQLPNFSLKN